MPEQQLHIEWEDAQGQQRRATKRGLERQQVLSCRIPDKSDAPERARPSTQVCKIVLRVLDEHVRSGEGWRIRQSVLAQECGLSIRSVGRATAWLIELGVVEITRTGRSHIYSLNRSQIARLCGAPEATLPPQQVTAPADQIGRTGRSDQTDRPIRSDGPADQIGRTGRSDLIKDLSKDLPEDLSKDLPEEEPPKSPKGDEAREAARADRSDQELATELMHQWNALAAEHECLSPIEDLGEQRRRKLRRAVRIDPSFESLWYRALAKVPITRDIHGWQPTFDWLLNPVHCRQLAEGQYDRSDGAATSKAQARREILDMIRRFGSDP